MRQVLALLALMLGALCPAETLTTDAKILKVDDSIVLQVGTQPLAVADGFETRYWRDRAPAKKEAFKEGDAVVARIKTDADPPQLRELADKPTQGWLDGIRKGIKRGSIVKVDAKFVTLKFDDGSTFAYRATDKTDVKVKGKASSLSALDEGMVVYAKGRLLPNLDTFLAEVTDVAPVIAPAKSSKEPGKMPKLTPLKADGLLEGTVRKHLPELSMFDIEADRLLHITYTNATKFTLDGNPTTRSALRPLIRAKIAYKRDQAGRIIASRVDLFSN